MHESAYNQQVAAVIMLLVKFKVPSSFNVNGMPVNS